MKKTLALLALASALPLAAQSFEAGVLYTSSQAKHSTFSGGGTDYDFKPDNWKAAGLRFGYNFIHIGPMEIQGNATMQFSNSADYTVKTNGAVNPGGSQFHEDYKYWAVGAAVNWDFLVRLGVGLEYRSEKLQLNVPAAGISDSTTYGRPWVRATAGFTIPAPIVKPFVGLEVAFPLTSTSSGNYNEVIANDWESVNKSVAPKSQFGIYAGVRF